MLVNFVFLFVLHFIVWVIARSSRSLDGFLLLRGASVAAVAILSLPASELGGLRAVVISMLALAWGLRLALHHFVREQLLGVERWPLDWMLAQGKDWHRRALRKFVVPQVLIVWTATFTIQHGIIAGAPLPLSLLDVLGGLLVVGGISLESLADRQLLVFRQIPANRSGVLDSGVWGWSRHPNHFGTLVVAWGFYLLAASAGDGLWGLLGALLVTVWVTRVAGRGQEEGMEDRRPGYSLYQRQVSPLFPSPPRAAAADPMPESALKFFRPPPGDGRDPPSDRSI
jgi:steroid 5-alpha reductase family enzyme